MKKILIIVSFLFIGICAFSQLNETVISKKHELGLHLGSTSGMGLSYRFWPNDLGVQFTFLPYKNLKIDNETNLNFAITGLYSFYHKSNFRVFGYVSNYIKYNKIEYDDLNKKNKENLDYNIGFGPGFGFGNRVRFDIMFGYGLYDISDKLNVFPTGEIGLYYRF